MESRNDDDDETTTTATISTSSMTITTPGVPYVGWGSHTVHENEMKTQRLGLVGFTISLQASHPLFNYYTILFINIGMRSNVDNVFNTKECKRYI